MTTPVDVAIRMELLDNEVKRDVGQVRAEFQRLNRDLKSSGTAAKTTTADYDRMRVAAARLGDQVGTGLSRVLIAQHQHAGVLSGSLGRLVTGYALLNAAQRGYSAVANMQDATKSFEGFVGSQREAVDLAKQLQGIKSPFATSGMLSGAQALLAHNTAARDVVPTLTAISDAVAGTGGDTSKLTAATTAIGELRSSTYLTSGALAQLQASVPTAADMLAKSHGMTAEGLQSALDSGGLRIAGKRAADELLKDMAERYKGAAARDTSLRGAVTSLGNAASASLYKAIGPELPEISAFIHTMAGELPMLATAASPFLKVLGETLGFMAEHPHLTEGLAGFLIFRQVAGPAIRMATAMFDIGRALKTIKSSEEVLLLLRSLGGVPGGLPGMPGTPRPGTPTGSGPDMPPLVLTSSDKDVERQRQRTASRRGEKVGNWAGKSAGAAITGMTTDAIYGSTNDLLQGHFGHSNDRDTVHWQDPAKIVLNAQKTAAAAGAAGWSLGGPVGGIAGLVGGWSLGAGKGLWDFAHHRQTYSMSDAGKRDLAAQREASSLLGGVQINVHGESVDEIMRKISPQLRQQLERAMTERERSAAARKQVPFQ